MTTLILSCNEARGNAVAYHLDGRSDPFPPERFEIKTAADAQRLFDQYVACAEASKLSLYVSARLGNGDRAPKGYKHLNLRKFVNRVER